MSSNNEMLDLAHLLAEEFEISVATEDQLQKVIDLVRGPPAQGTTDGDQLCIARADIALLSNAMREACEFLMETKYGSPARSPGHNARVRLERALELVGVVPAEIATVSEEILSEALGNYRVGSATFDETMDVIRTYAVSRQSPAVKEPQALCGLCGNWHSGDECPSQPVCDNKEPRG